MLTFYPTQRVARADAASGGQREKVLRFIVRDEGRLVFEHAGQPDAGMQVPAGGAAPSEPPEQAAIRERREVSGLALTASRYPVSNRLKAQMPERLTRQVCHAFTPLPSTPDTRDHDADGHRFTFRWVPRSPPASHWEMDAALP